VVLVWAVLSVLELPNATYTGYSSTPQNVAFDACDPGPPRRGFRRVGFLGRSRSFAGLATHQPSGKASGVSMVNRI
jgi:hypothetical protein